MRSWRSVKDEINSHKGKYVLAISGGVDSMCLLDFFIRCVPKDNFCVAHFNHGNRDNDILDMALVEGYAEYNGVEFYADNGVGLSDIGNFECEARNQRWEFLYNIANKVESKVVVTAHHKNDLIETFFIRSILRGVPVQESIMKKTIVRDSITRYKPFLHLQKSDMYKIAKRYNIPFNEDETNTDTSYDRNFIRHAILPALMKRRNILKTIPNSLGLQQ